MKSALKSSTGKAEMVLRNSLLLSSKFELPEEECSEVCVMHILFSGGSVWPDSQPLGLGVPLEGVQIEDGARIHQTGQGSEKASVPLVFQCRQHGSLPRKK